ncbi:MAG: hypothetical protein WBF71_04330 [Microthrixaceae bacterium]
MADSSPDPSLGSDLSRGPEPGFEEVRAATGPPVAPEAWLGEQVERLVNERRVSDRAGTPVIVGVAGSVAVGKSRLAVDMAETMSVRSPGCRTVVVATDSFLLPNLELERLGLSMRKGFPESFDYSAMHGAISALRQGRVVKVPEYSHVSYDIVPGEFTTIDHPTLVIIEGVNALQPPPGRGVEVPLTDAVADLVDLGVYLDADPSDIETWFVDRFLRMCAQARDDREDLKRLGQQSAGSQRVGFYAGFAGIDPSAIRSIAEWTWSEINEPNLRGYIEPSRSVADVIIEKGPDHRIRRVFTRS